jgi:hypothetical protein
MRFLTVLLALAATAPAATKVVLWTYPGNPATYDLGGTAGSGVNLPKPPFRFVREDPSGTQLKVFVRDGSGAEWNVKFGFEAKTESFAWRLVRACGYFAEPNFLVESGRIEGMGPLRRSDTTLHADGQFINGRFQWRDPHYHFLKHAWSWQNNPFRGTSQLAGLKILIMLVSNWDNKDSSNDGPNTALFRHRDELIYTFTDWGAGLGKWGHLTGQNNWRCEDFTAQNSQFIQGVKGGHVVFGYEGGHQADFQNDIRPKDVAWLLKYLGRITDDQLRAGLKSAGATPDEQECFTKALRSRMEALRAVAK